MRPTGWQRVAMMMTMTMIDNDGNDDDDDVVAATAFTAVSMGGPLEVMELLTPIMSLTSLLLSVAWEKLWDVIPGSPYFASPADVGTTLVIIFVGAMLAFLMVS